MLQCTMYHAGNVLQTNASKHAYRSKSYLAYTQICISLNYNEKQIEYKFKTRSCPFESLPEMRCSINAIQTNACTEHLIPQMQTGSDEAQQSPKENGARNYSAAPSMDDLGI